jgi:ubiquitin carboxyl-terminal hydrolase 4/11/15
LDKALDKPLASALLGRGSKIVIEEELPSGTFPSAAAASSSAAPVASSASAAAGSRANDDTSDSDDDYYQPGRVKGSSGLYGPSYSSRYGSSSYSGGYNSYSDSGYGAGVTPGHVGLSNLGNTCFMNSALQCLSHTPDLRRYFVDEQQWQRELNRDNPIGCGGALAEAFADLLYDLWSGRRSTVAPREVKTVVSRHAPQFSGYAQHDSQELTAFLLDGLHEDLNRIVKKPYVEAKEVGPREGPPCAHRERWPEGGRHLFLTFFPPSHPPTLLPPPHSSPPPQAEGQPDPQAAAEAWGRHKLRNNSIIVDLFHGQLKSTLVCPTCDKVSVTFDPLMYLSLPLPEKDKAVFQVYVVSPDGLSVVKYGVTLPKRTGTIGDMKRELERLTGLSAMELEIHEIYYSRSYKRFEDHDKTSSLRRDDVLVGGGTGHTVVAAYMLLAEGPPRKDASNMLTRRVFILIIARSPIICRSCPMAVRADF